MIDFSTIVQKYLDEDGNVDKDKIDIFALNEIYNAGFSFAEILFGPIKVLIDKSK